MLVVRRISVKLEEQAGSHQGCSEVSGSNCAVVCEHSQSNELGPHHLQPPFRVHCTFPALEDLALALPCLP